MIPKPKHLGMEYAEQFKDSILLRLIDTALSMRLKSYVY
jgi:hypothetical protein